MLNEINKYCSVPAQESLSILEGQESYFSAEMRSVCQKFLNLHNLCFFSFYRIYEDGTCILLSSHPSSLTYVFNHKIHITPHIPLNNIKEKFWYIIPPNSIYQEFLNDFRGMFGSQIIFDYIELYKGYYEVSYFASHCQLEIATAHFLNNKEEFERFSAYFKQHFASLISCYENKKIILPDEMRSNICGLNISGAQQKILPSRLIFPQEKKLTARELECVYHLSLGHTAKETAQQLGLSFRTVEYYLSNIKDKLKCDRKSEIISVLSSLNNKF